MPVLPGTAGFGNTEAWPAPVCIFVEHKASSLDFGTLSGSALTIQPLLSEKYDTAAWVAKRTRSAHGSETPEEIDMRTSSPTSLGNTGLERGHHPWHATTSRAVGVGNDASRHDGANGRLPPSDAKFWHATRPCGGDISCRSHTWRTKCNLLSCGCESSSEWAIQPISPSWRGPSRWAHLGSCSDRLRDTWCPCVGAPSFCTDRSLCPPSGFRCSSCKRCSAERCPDGDGGAWSYYFAPCKHAQGETAGNEAGYGAFWRCQEQSSSSPTCRGGWASTGRCRQPIWPFHRRRQRRTGRCDLSGSRTSGVTALYISRHEPGTQSGETLVPCRLEGQSRVGVSLGKLPLAMFPRGQCRNHESLLSVVQWLMWFHISRVDCQGCTVSCVETSWITVLCLPFFPRLLPLRSFLCLSMSHLQASPLGWGICLADGDFLSSRRFPGCWVCSLRCPAPCSSLSRLLTLRPPFCDFRPLLGLSSLSSPRLPLCIGFFHRRFRDASFGLHLPQGSLHGITGTLRRFQCTDIMLHLIPFVRVDTVGLCYTSGHGALPFLLPRCLIDTSVALGYQPRQKDEAGIKVYNALYALHVTPLTGAPKSRIGGSGTTALSLVNNMHSAARVELLLPFEVVGSFFRSLLFTSFLALCLLLGKPFARRHRSLRRVWLSCATPSVLGVNLALRCASPDCPVLDWRVAAKKRCRHPTERATCRSYGSPSLLGRLAFACLGFSEFPFLVRAAPHPDLATLLGFQFLPEIASASQSLPEDLPDRATSTQDCLSHAGIRTNAAIGDDKAPCTTSFVRVPPSLPGAVRKSQDSSILGVTIYAPFFVPTFFGLRTEKDVQLEAVLAAVREIGHMPSRHLDVLIPITRQRFDLSLGLLAFPSFLLQVKPTICPVILDLTRVGGHYCADTLPSPCSRHEFLEHIAMLIWYHEEEVEIWIDNSEFPASHGVLSFAPGSVFTVVLHGIGPMRTYDVKEVLSPNAVWGPFEHSPSPRGPMGTAIVDTREAAYMPVSMLSPLWPDQNVHRALKLAPHEGVLPTEFHVYLDIHGKQCHTVFSGPSDAHPWLIDFRPLGFQMRVVYSRIEPDLATP